MQLFLRNSKSQSLRCRMSNSYWLNEAQMERFQHYFAVIRGPTRADVRHVLKGIIFTSHNELRQYDVPAKYGRLKTLYNRWKRSSGASVFAKIMVGLTKLATDKKKISNHSHQNCISIACQRTLLTSKHIARLSGYNLKRASESDRAK